MGCVWDYVIRDHLREEQNTIFYVSVLSELLCIRSYFTLLYGVRWEFFFFILGARVLP